MSLVAERCDRIRDEVTMEALFGALNWDLPQRGRIRCIWPDHEDRTPAMQVYLETNSVHCFACNKGGDVVEVAWRCGNPEGGAWSLEDALDWLEEEFGLARMSPAQSFKGKLRKKLARLHQPAVVEGSRAQRTQKSQLDAVIQQAFNAVEAKASPDQVVAAGSMKDYIWEEGDAPGVDLMEWASWARRLIYGSYAKLLGMLHFPPPPADVVDDRPETCRRARLWELHRGTEYSSDWHLQLF